MSFSEFSPIFLILHLPFNTVELTCTPKKMEAQQKTLDCFIKSRKRPAIDDGIHKKGLINSSKIIEVVKPSRQLVFDDIGAVPVSIKKQKVNFIKLFKLYLR